ncbi:acyl-[acyl-carrier-protein] thioesterase [Desulfovermiculus halophilus]|jgi:acyl-ACP thioesterase|uniref:acyl-[acyl-carrier-protein] thioesterase n=1 Tax=Desulfovermiculus halophilus TaxID=339722 RepID=UPI000489CAB8|nr:acyl-ACP thioesterase domain-containing protein [Desulfovermiculus halophilus]
MRVDLPWTVSYLDVDESFQLKPMALVRQMEEAAIRHTDLVGLSARDLYQEQGLAWMMYKIGLKILSLPAYGQELTVTTWSKGIKGFRALREFQIRDRDRVLARATSLWLLYDLRAERLKRIPGEMAEAYEIEAAHALDWDLAQWKPDADFPCQTTLPVTTRTSDFDLYGHVNHAVYIDYIDTALATTRGHHTWEGEVKIAFLRQIPRQVKRVDVLIGPEQETEMIGISTQDTVCALAERKTA